MIPPDSVISTRPPGRVVVAGKNLSMDGRRWFLNAISYGPFKTKAQNEPYSEASRLASDFASIRELGFNSVRIYELPTETLLRAAEENGLRLIVGIPWTDHIDFMRDPALREQIQGAVRDAAQRFGRHPSVAVILVGNEIEKTLVRWMGPERVKAFVESLIDVAREAAPDCLISYATYPSTEYLMPGNADFLAVNVYLEDRAVFAKYALRLQNLAGLKPLVITEFGIDVQANGADKQAEVMRWQREELLRLGIAGNVWFSFTDEWFRGGGNITKWSFGITGSQREPRSAAKLASALPIIAEAVSGPRISVVVCTRNGRATLSECLEALGRQRYANREIIVIDDGSTDDVPLIAKSYPFVRYIHQHHAGLSVARNLGAAHATGEIIAFTDDDCVPDADWLIHLARAFDEPHWVAAGGPNLPPPTTNRIEAIVAQAPGGPAHVLINDQEAEHLPGCNLAIRKSALDAISGFQPQFRTAGDDVDVCWRLRERGGGLRFVPAAFVWHHRRFTVRAYLKQQHGYGYAEALLMKTHSQRFGPLGGARWRGLIYGEPSAALEPSEGSVFHGPRGTGLFQVIYAQGVGMAWWDWLGGVLWIVLALMFAALNLPLMSVALVLTAGWMAWKRGRGALFKSTGDRALLWFLCLVQPITREWARLVGMINLGARPSFRPTLPDILPPKKPLKTTRRLEELTFWSEEGAGRDEWLRELRVVLTELKLPFREDEGWRWFDVEVGNAGGSGFPFTATGAYVSVTEYHGGKRMLTRVAVCQREGIWQKRATILFPFLVSVCVHAARWFGGQPFALLPLVLGGLAGSVFAGGVVWFLNSTSSGVLREHAIKAARRAGLEEHPLG